MKRAVTFSVVLLFLLPVCYLFADQSQQGTKSFAVSKGGTLKISLVTGDVRINTWDKNEVSVKLDDIDDMDEANSHKINISQNGNTVIVENRGGGWWSSSNDVSVSVPREFNLDVKTNQGDVDLKSDIKGWVDINTGGGDVTVKKITGKATLNTNGGDINTDDVYGELNLSTNGGDIVAGNISGNAHISTLGGSIETGNISGNLYVKTNGGEIHAGEIGGTANATTMGGGIILKKVSKSAIAKTNGGNIKLAGSAGPVTVKTLGGNIDLYDVSGPVEATTNAGNINVELKSVGNGPSNISTMAGNISLYINQAEKVTINALVKSVHPHSDGNAVVSDIPAKIYDVGKYTGAVNATYLLNGGGEQITLKTIIGTVKIIKIKK